MPVEGDLEVNELNNRFRDSGLLQPLKEEEDKKRKINDAKRDTAVISGLLELEKSKGAVDLKEAKAAA